MKASHTSICAHCGSSQASDDLKCPSCGADTTFAQSLGWEDDDEDKDEIAQMACRTWPVEDETRSGYVDVSVEIAELEYSDQAGGRLLELCVWLRDEGDIDKSVILELTADGAQKLGEALLQAAAAIRRLGSD
jgi:coenzyme F420-reducing hydrogenase beta subunit